LLRRERPAELDPVERDRFRAALAAARGKNLAALAEYRKRGRFPQYDGQRSFGVPSVAHRIFEREPVFIDERGVSCAVAHLMQKSGWGQQAEAIAEADVHVRVERVVDGPLLDWILRSGLTHDEVTLIQPDYEALIRESKRALLRETRRLSRHFEEVERQLRLNAAISLDIALARLVPLIVQRRVAVHEIGARG
jgi:hypothetical protein